MYLLKNYKINFKNFIYKKISENFKNKTTLRFSPEPNNYIHIGHYKNILINIIICKIFNGKFLLRIDDTNNKNCKNKYKKNIKLNLKNLNNLIKFNYIKKIKFSSKNFNKLYQYIKYFTKIYYKNFLKIKKFKKGFLKKKKKTIFYKNKKFKLILYRINYINHIKTIKNWYIYPLYNYSQPILDKIDNIYYSLCTLEFQKYKKIYKKFIKLIYKNLKNSQLESNKLNFINNLTSKKKIKYLKKYNFIKNFKDIRLLTIKSLLKKNFKIKYLIYFFYNNSFNKKNKKINYNILKNYIYKNLYLNYIKIKLINNSIIIILLNYKNLKKKKIFLKKYFIIEKNILIKNINFLLNLNNYLNLKESLLFKIIGFKKNIIGKIKNFYSKYFFNLKKKNFYKKINWINLNHNMKINNILKKNIINKLNKNINLKSIKKKNCIINSINLKNLKNKNYFKNIKINILIINKIKLNKISTLNDSNV